MTGRVLIVDDDTEQCRLLADHLQEAGYEVTWRARAAEALELLQAGSRFDVVVTDLRMPGLSGEQLCQQVVASHPELPVIVVTAFGSLETAIGAIRAGAYDFLTKPFDLDVLEVAVARAVQHRQLREEVRRLRRAVEVSENYEDILGASPVMLQLFRAIEQVAVSDASVVIRGPTGTGKELVARAIHRRSRRREGPFVAVNCAAIPEALLESELFGHARGAFTGAVERREGLLLQAQGGTLFLDEVGDMPPPMQAKLLRVLQERRVRPVGGDAERVLDVRVVAATLRDLEAAVEEGRFRQDLYFRLNVIGIEVPPLRARGNDVLLLAQHFLGRAARRAGKRVTGITPQAAERLLGYGWPGNVRELENCVERAVALTQHEQLLVDDLPEKVRSYRPADVVLPTEDPSALVSMEEVERRYVLKVLESVQGHRGHAAKILGFDRKTLYRKLERWGVTEPASERGSPAT